MRRDLRARRATLAAVAAAALALGACGGDEPKQGAEVDVEIPAQAPGGAAADSGATDPEGASPKGRPAQELRRARARFQSLRRQLKRRFTPKQRARFRRMLRNGDREELRDFWETGGRGGPRSGGP